MNSSGPWRKKSDQAQQAQTWRLEYPGIRRASFVTKIHKRQPAL
jgi:hypothetical protein